MVAYVPQEMITDYSLRFEIFFMGAEKPGEKDDPLKLAVNIELKPKYITKPNLAPTQTSSTEPHFLSRALNGYPLLIPPHVYRVMRYRMAMMWRYVS